MSESRQGFDYEDLLRTFQLLEPLRQPKWNFLDGFMGLFVRPLVPIEAMAPNQFLLDDNFKQVEAMILSMTPEERWLKVELDDRRRARIARGSGTQPEQVVVLQERLSRMQADVVRLMRKSRSHGRANAQALADPDR